MDNKNIDNNKYGFVDRLEALRTSLGYTKVQLAEYLGIDKSLVSLVYSNRRSITQNFYDKLIEMTSHDELYWRFGIDHSLEIMQSCKHFTSTIGMILEFQDTLLSKNPDKTFLEQVYKLIGNAATLDLKNMKQNNLTK